MEFDACISQDNASDTSISAVGIRAALQLRSNKSSPVMRSILSIIVACACLLQASALLFPRTNVILTNDDGNRLRYIFPE